MSSTCKSCSRPVPVDRSPRGYTRFHILGAVLDSWGTAALDTVGGIHFRDLKPCDAVVGVQAGLYDNSGEPLEGVGSLIDIYSARRQIEQIEWPAGTPADPKDGGAWGRLRAVRGMRVTMGGIRRTATRARELYANNFAQSFPMPGDFESRDYAPVISVMWAHLTTVANVNFQCAIDYREQAYCAG